MAALPVQLTAAQSAHDAATGQQEPAAASEAGQGEGAALQTDAERTQGQAQPAQAADDAAQSGAAVADAQGSGKTGWLSDQVPSEGQVAQAAEALHHAADATADGSGVHVARGTPAVSSEGVSGEHSLQAGSATTASSAADTLSDAGASTPGAAAAAGAGAGKDMESGMATGSGGGDEGGGVEGDADSAPPECSEDDTEEYEPAPLQLAGKDIDPDAPETDDERAANANLVALARKLASAPRALLHTFISVLRVQMLRCVWQFS